jgi:hypothetical protein
MSPTARFAGNLPIEHVVLRAAGQRVNRGGSVTPAVDAALTFTLFARTVLQTQIEYLRVPPGVVLETRGKTWAVRQIAPG